MDLAKYRLIRAKEDLETASDNLENGKYRASVNRSYHAVFHAIRAVTALDSFDSETPGRPFSFHETEKTVPLFHLFPAALLPMKKNHMRTIENALKAERGLFKALSVLYFFPFG